MSTTAEIINALSGNCLHCGTRHKWNGFASHSPDCPLIDFETAKWYAQNYKDSIERCRMYEARAFDAAKRWEGKFRIVCHENNQLRKRLRAGKGRE